MQTHVNPVYDYRRPPELDSAEPVHHPLVVVGAGPVGMVAGLDAASHGIPCLILDDNDTVSVGSRAVCYAKRALEILDRLGCGQRMVDKGITWNLGRVFYRDEEIYRFDLLPETGHERPAFINLQQYYFEEYLVDRIGEVKGLDLRWKNRVTAVGQDDRRVRLTVATPDGDYRLTCDHLIVCDGANSGIRRMLGLESRGQVFQDRFLIADVVMENDWPPERWFWFDPPFHGGQSTLLHRQADNLWRIDFQLGWDADPEEEKRPERVLPRLRAMLGEEAEFQLEWTSVYTFQCRRMERFRHGRIFFAGDAAHQVSPFGARGANSGIQDTDNLLWKLRLVTSGAAPDTLLDSYDSERVPAADENILHSTRSTSFISPGSGPARLFRDATLLLSKRCPFARTLVNSGRLSLPAVYRDSPLNTPDEDPFDSPVEPGAPACDAPVAGPGGGQWFLRILGNGGFNILYFAGAALSVDEERWLGQLRQGPVPLRILVAGLRADSQLPDGMERLDDREGLLGRRLDATPGSLYLFRPDQHLAARWRHPDSSKVLQALDRALARERTTP